LDSQAAHREDEDRIERMVADMALRTQAYSRHPCPSRLDPPFGIESLA
jgi:hypothetical protein